MCGIAGIIYFDKRKVPVPLISGMTDALSHRGPDENNFRVFGNIALGHRRLVIIDPNTGTQPMCDKDGIVWITYNGEIYNFKELRDDLQNKGYVFRTSCDTEVVIYAYKEWGKKCVEHFRGMFAFAILDLKKKSVFIARDHFGIKPLYYIKTKKFFAFASELQALKIIPGVDLSIDIDSLKQYMQLQYIPAPLTIFKEIKKLTHAHCLEIDFIGKKNDLEKYWKFEFKSDKSKSLSYWFEEFESVVNESVQSHLVSDVPFGMFLSGGIDSTMILSYMTKNMKRPVNTFTIGFNDTEFSEIKYARKAAQKFKSNHFEEIIDVDALQILPDLVKHFGEPFGDYSSVPTYYLSRLARKKVPMVLSGDGADEFFGGYKTYAYWLKFIKNKHHNKDISKKTLYNWLNIVGMDSTLMHFLWKKEFEEINNRRLSGFESLFKKGLGYSNNHVVQNVDINTFLPYSILTKVDVTSMMNGLEVRTPFLDKKVAELAMRIPENFNIKTYKNSVNGKLILKKVLSKDFDKKFIDRRKMGFAIPVNNWFSNNPKMKEYISDTILNDSAEINEFFNKDIIKSIMNGHSGVNKWRILFLEEWFRNEKTINRITDIESLDIKKKDFEPLLNGPESSIKPTFLKNYKIAQYLFERREFDKLESYLIKLMNSTKLSTTKMARVFYMYSELNFKKNNKFDTTTLNKIISILEKKKDITSVQKYLIASINKKLGNVDKSIIKFKKIISVKNDKNIKCGANFHLGELYYNKEKYSKSLEYFKETLSINRDHKKAFEYIKIIEKEGKNVS